MALVLKGNVYNSFITENIAPKNAKGIAVYDSNGDKFGTIPLGFLTPPKKQKLYSVELVSDVHTTYDTASEDFQRALIHLENSDCDFMVIDGDLSSTGARTELELFMSIINQHTNKPVHFKPGNHENYETTSQSYYEEVTGRPRRYYFEHNGDVFIMLGHYGGYKGDGIGWIKGDQFAEDDLQWLYEILEANRNKRCFVFVHVFPWGGSGNALGAYTSNMWTSTKGTVFENLMKHYKNVTVFHGHSHLKLALQALDEKANYSSVDGYRSVHIPSLSVPRDIVDGSLSVLYAESEGYIMDVYDDYIILNGMDFIDNENDGNILPIATYKIDTKLVNVPAGTFTDSTGIIQVA